MRLVRWLLVAFAIFYAVYCVATTAWAYIELSYVVEQALAGPARSGGGTLRRTIIMNAAERGIPLKEGDVYVNEANRVILVRVKWSFPAVRWQGDDIVEIPVWVERSVAAP
jgi:hypothetical protein